MIWARDKDRQLFPIPEVIGRGQEYVPSALLSEIVCAYTEERILEYTGEHRLDYEAGIDYRDALIKAKAALEIYDIYSQQIERIKEEYYGLSYNRKTKKSDAKRKERK